MEDGRSRIKVWLRLRTVISSSCSLTHAQLLYSIRTDVRCAASGSGGAPTPDLRVPIFHGSDVHRFHSSTGVCALPGPMGRHLSPDDAANVFPVHCVLLAGLSTPSSPRASFQT